MYLNDEDLDSQERGYSPKSSGDISKDPASFYKGHSDAETSEKAKLGDRLKGKSDSSSGGFYKSSKSGSFKNAINKTLGSKKRKKRIIIGASIGGGVGTLSIVGFFLLIPFKLLSITNGLEEHFFAASDVVTQKYVDNVFSTYLKKYVLPGLSASCNSTLRVDRSCAVAPTGSSPIDLLYHNWRDTNFEGKLAAPPYNLEFAKRGHQYYLVTPGNSDISLGSDTDPDSFVNDKSGASLYDYLDSHNLGDPVTRSDIRAKFYAAIEGQTFFKKVLIRIRLGGLLKRKYGVELYVIAPNSRDSFADWKDKKATQFQTALVSHVIEPHSDLAGVFMNCLLSGGCDKSGSAPPDINDDGIDLNDPAESKLSNAINATLSKLGIESVEDAQSAADQILTNKGGFSQYVFEQLLINAGFDNAADIAESSAGGVGIINFVVSTFYALIHAGKAIKVLTYLIAADGAVQLFTMEQTAANEVQTGNVDAATVGSFNNSFGGTTTGSAADGTTGQSAEDSPLYQTILGTSNQPVTSSPFTSPIASALSPQAVSMICDNGKSSLDPSNDNSQTNTSGQICPEESLTANGNSTGSRYLSALASIPVLGQFVDVWHDTVGQVFGGLNDVISAALDVCCKPLINAISSKLQPLLIDAVSYLLPFPISPTMSGARNFDMSAAGADALSSDYCHYKLGCEAITPKQAAANINEENQMNEAQLAIEPWYDRITDKNNPDSVVSQVALAMPPNIADGIHSFATTVIRNPIATVMSTFANIFSVGRANAAAQPIPDPFGVVQYGYPTNDPIFTTDPESLTTSYCQKYSNWTNSGTGPGTTYTDPNTGLTVNTTENPCLLQTAVIEGLGAISSNGALIDPTDTQ